MFFGFIGIVELALGLILIPLCLLSFVFWIWMLIHAIRNDGLSDTQKLIWVVVIVFTHFVGALIYLFVGLPKRRISTSA